MRLRSERIFCGIILTTSLFLSQPVLAVSAPPAASPEKIWESLTKRYETSGDADWFQAAMRQNAPRTFAYISERLRSRPFISAQYETLTTTILTAYKTPNPKFFKKNQTKEQYRAQIRSTICQWVDRRITAQKGVPQEQLEFELELLIKAQHPAMIPCIKRLAADTQSKQKVHPGYWKVVEAIGNANGNKNSADAYKKSYHNLLAIQIVVRFQRMKKLAQQTEQLFKEGGLRPPRKRPRGSPEFNKKQLNATNQKLMQAKPSYHSDQLGLLK